jgi:hypothetical protein
LPLVVQLGSASAALPPPPSGQLGGGDRQVILEDDLGAIIFTLEAIYFCMLSHLLLLGMNLKLFLLGSFEDFLTFYFLSDSSNQSPTST